MVWLVLALLGLVSPLLAQEPSPGKTANLPVFLADLANPNDFQVHCD